MSPRVSVVLPAYYSDGTIGACLEAITAQTWRDFEVIVVNSSPETRTAELVTTRFPGVRFHQSATRLLPHAARNVAVSLSAGDIIVFTDPDCVPHPEWLAWLVHAHDEGFAIVQGSVARHGDGWLERGVHLCKRFALLQGLSPYPLWIISSVNVSYSRAAWAAGGPLDGHLFCGDALLGWRAMAQGQAARFEPRAIVANVHDESLPGLVRQRYARGREFAGVRAAHEGWSRGRAALFAAAAPLLLVVVLWRAGQTSASAGYARDFALTLPVQIAGHVAWILGESREYARRAIAASLGEARRPLDHRTS
jgi:glycosyltransferase involved in cell wall biosynthesis